jgi:hypothetical protein
LLNLQLHWATVVRIVEQDVNIQPHYYADAAIHSFNITACETGRTLARPPVEEVLRMTRDLHPIGILEQLPR